MCTTVAMQQANMDWQVDSVPLLTSSNPVDPRRTTVHDDDASNPGIDFLRSHEDLPKKTQPSSIMPERRWRPAYLRTRVLGAFCIVFALMAVALEILTMLSARNNGIASGAYGDHYLWTYGPTAFLTVIAALFSRVEYQSKMIAPWQHMLKQPTEASRSLLLDYVSQIQPVTICRSLRNRDFTVSAASIISVLLKIMTILSTGLITLSLTAVRESEIPMVLQNIFVDDDTMLKSNWTLPKYFMYGLLNGTGEYPPGITKDFAFQTVETSLPATAQIQVTLDGLTNSLVCEPANLILNEARQAGFNDNKKTGSANINVTSRSCEITGAEVFGPNAAEEDELPYSPLFGHFSEVRCDGATDDSGNRVLVWFGQIEWFVDETILVESNCFGHHCYLSQIHGRLLESAQLLCSPTYDISRIDLIKNGTEIQTVELSRSPAAQNRTLDHVTPWSIMRAHYDSFGPWYDGISDGPNHERNSFDLDDGIIIDVDPYIQFILESRLPPATNASSLYDLSLLETMVQSHYRQYGAIIARQALMRSQSTNTTGSALVMTNRLMVRSWSGQWMAGSAAVCLLLTAMMVLMSPRLGTLPCSPFALSGVAAVVSHSAELMVILRDAGDADEKQLSRTLKSFKFQSGIAHNATSGQSQITVQDTVKMGMEKNPQPLQQSQSSHAHPGLLHPCTRLALCVTLFGVVAALEVTLHQSEQNDGLGDVADDTYIHYLWTSMPALVLEGLVLMINSMEFNIRSLAPYIILNGTINTDVFPDLELLDMSIPWAIYQEARLRSLGVLATTMTLLIASFFTIFSSSLFQASSLPQTSFVGLDMQDFITNRSDHVSQSLFTSALILYGNLSYPKFTCEDLVFPQMLPVPLVSGNSMSNSSSLSIRTQIPALRARLRCRMFDPSRIHIEWAASDILGPAIDITFDSDTHDSPCVSYSVPVDARLNTSYFGLADNAWQYGCGDYIYTWGRLDYSVDPPVTHIAATSCNATVEAVDVAVEFAGADLRIDSQRPPSPIEATARHPAVFLSLSDLYHYIPRINWPSASSVDGFFYMLTTSRFAIALETLGDPARDEDVVAALRFQHGILAAQALHASRAPPANISAVDAVLTDSEAMVTATGPDADPEPKYTYRATVTDPVGRRRVIQDAASTRVLEALLLAAAVLLLVGWATLPRTNVLPDRSPTTIASAVALLAGGNILEHLPEDAEWRGKEGVRAALGKGTRLWLGWGRMPDEEGIAMGNENENGVSRFGIFVVPPDEETSSEAGVGQRGET